MMENTMQAVFPLFHLDIGPGGTAIRGLGQPPHQSVVAPHQQSELRCCLCVIFSHFAAAIWLGLAALFLRQTGRALIGPPCHDKE